jgi:glycosyltransferase involved in cell wall biosynthesis
MSLPALVFVLPSRGAGGGSNSVVQEAMGLASLGVSCLIAVDERNVSTFLDNYPELIGHDVVVRPYDKPSELARHLVGRNVAVATTNGSMFDLSEACNALSAEERKDLKIAYYVQDYEPLFYEPQSPRWKKAYDSYALNGQAALFAKTGWLCRIVYENHGIKVSKVAPSLDHAIFYPDLAAERTRLTVTAMLRPRTQRRAPKRTARVMNILSDRFSGGGAVFQVFGGDDEEFEASGLELSQEIVNKGVLKRTDVPELMRASDLFLDLSDYQAFGRTGLEAMACGCVPLVPILGGTAEYAVHGRNAFVVDTRSDDAVLSAVETFVGLSPAQRREMRQAGLETAAEFSVLKAALSELRLFRALSGL